MLQRVNHYLTSWVLLFALSSHLWHTSVCSPVGARGKPANLNPTTAVALARSLLWNVTKALTVDDLFKGINCTEQSTDLNTRTQTVSVCAPKHTKCSGYSKMNFDQDECLWSVIEDLHYYREALLAHSNQIIRSTVLWSIDQLMQNGFAPSLLEDSPTQEVSRDRDNTFDGRLKLCKALKGLRVRTVTINRIMGYILDLARVPDE